MAHISKATPEYANLAARAYQRYSELNETINAFNAKAKESTLSAEDIERMDAMHFERDHLVEDFGLDVLSP